MIVPDDPQAKEMLREMRDFLNMKSQEEADPSDARRLAIIAHFFDGGLQVRSLMEEHELDVEFKPKGRSAATYRWITMALMGVQIGLIVFWLAAVIFTR